MNRPLAIAIGRYAHVEPLTEGRVRIDGIDPQFVHPRTEQIIQRMLRHGEWEVAEFSLAQYVALRARGDDSLVAIPVFPSRVFRHGSFYVRRRTLSDPRELAGRRVGVPEWVQTAGIWARGMLRDQYGVDPAEIEWTQAGVNTPGREEGTPVTLPPGISCTPRPDASLDELLTAGELDAILSARPPRSVAGGETTRLLCDHRAAEREWLAQTGFIPIMHVVVVRGDVYESARWIPGALLAAFDAARRECLAELAEPTSSTVPLPWIPELLDELVDATGGGDWWPYGVEGNRAALEAFLGYCRDQGVIEAPVTPESLFAPETVSDART